MSTDSPRIPHRASTGYKRDSVSRALGYGHAGLKTSYDHLRWEKFGWSWAIGGGGGVVRNRAMLCDVAAIEGPRTTSWQFLVMFKNMVSMPDIVEYRTMIARRRATSLDIMRCRGCCLFHVSHVLTCTAFSRCCAIVVLRHRIRDRTIIVRFYSCSDDDFSFSADNHNEVLRPRHMT